MKIYSLDDIRRTPCHPDRGRDIIKVSFVNVRFMLDRARVAGLPSLKLRLIFMLAFVDLSVRR